MWKCVAQQRKTKEAEKEDYMREIMWQYEDKIITHLEYIEKFAYKNLPAEFIFSLNFCIGLIFFSFFELDSIFLICHNWKNFCIALTIFDHF